MNIDSDTVKKLVDSIPNIILDFHKFRGGTTKYLSFVYKYNF